MRPTKDGEALVQVIVPDAMQRRLKALAAVRGTTMRVELTAALEAHLAGFNVPDLGPAADAIHQFTDRALDA